MGKRPRGAYIGGHTVLTASGFGWSEGSGSNKRKSEWKKSKKKRAKASPLPVGGAKELSRRRLAKQAQLLTPVLANNPASCLITAEEMSVRNASKKRRLRH